MEIDNIGDEVPIGRNKKVRIQKSKRSSRRKSNGELQPWRCIGRTKDADIDKLFSQHQLHDKLFKDKFGACIGMADSKAFAEGLFEALARRNNIKPEDGITKPQLELFWADLKSHDPDKQLHLFFDMCDKNGDGRLSEEEVKEVLVMSASANKLPKVEQNAGKYAALIVENLDSDQNGTIEMRELESLLRGMISSEGTIGGITGSPGEKRPSIKKILKKMSGKVLNNWKKIWVLTLWLCINVGLFTWKVEQYKKRGAFEVMGYCVCFAKGAGETLKFNMALMLDLILLDSSY